MNDSKCVLLLASVPRALFEILVSIGKFLVWLFSIPATV